MALATKMLIVWLCILFALYMADPENFSTGFLDFANGEFSFDWSTIILGSIGGVVGIVSGYLTHDLMTGAVTAIATTMVGWIVIPTNFLNIPGMPPEIRILLSAVLSIMWGTAILGFFRGYQP